MRRISYILTKKKKEEKLHNNHPVHHNNKKTINYNINIIDKCNNYN